MASMSTRRLGVAVAVLGGFLYAVGGSDGTSPLNTGMAPTHFFSKPLRVKIQIIVLRLDGAEAILTASRKKLFSSLQDLEQRCGVGGISSMTLQRGWRCCCVVLMMALVLVVEVRSSVRWTPQEFDVSYPLHSSCV